MAFRETFLYQLNVTRRCNLRCEHCYISAEKKDISPDWSIRDAMHIINGIVDHMKSPKGQHYRRAEIHIIGGEPTELGIGFFLDFLPAAKKALSLMGKEYSLCLVTNLLSSESLLVAKEFDVVSTSYEPSTRFKKKKHKTMWLDNISALSEHRSALGLSPIGVTSAITKEVTNIGASSYLDELTLYGFKNIHLGFFIPSGDGMKFKDICNPDHESTSNFLIDAFNWYVTRKELEPDLWVNPCQSWIDSFKNNLPSDDVVCPIISGSIDIDGDGETISCIEKGGELDYSSNGNVLEKVRVITTTEDIHHYQRSLSDILSSPKYLMEVAQASKLPYSCAGCEFRNLCKGNCSVLHSQWDGDGECPGFSKFLKHVKTYSYNDESIST